jgi:Outer membrane protein Omp28
MKKYSLIIIVTLFVASCVKEKTPTGLVLHEEISTKDSTYITTTIPAAQTKVLFFEEATGVHCSNCPDGSRLLKTLSNQNPGRILSAAVYSPFLNEYTPPKGTHDFNTDDAQQLVDFLGGDPSKPTAAIDRLPNVGGVLPYFYGSTIWADSISSMLSKKTPVNIELQSLKQGSDYILKSTLTFTDSITSSLAMSVYLLEDDIINYQNDNTVDVPNYVHNHVLVKILTPLSGSVFLNDIIQKEKGRVMERSFVYSLPSNVVNKANCKLLCFVHKVGSSKEVLQVQEVDL